MHVLEFSVKDKARENPEALTYHLAKQLGPRMVFRDTGNRKHQSVPQLTANVSCVRSAAGQECTVMVCHFRMTSYKMYL